MILVLKWQRMWLTCSCSSVLWKVEFESNETEYLAKETSKQSVEGVTWFFVTADRKM